MSKALDVQVGGNHYKNLKIQPVEYIEANGLGYFEGNIIKYATRWKNKNGVEDLRKVIHYAQLLIEFEEKKNGSKDCGTQQVTIGQGIGDLRIGVPPIHPRRDDDASSIQPKRPVFPGSPRSEITHPPARISNILGREQGRYVEQPVSQQNEIQIMCGAMGNVGLRGSSIMQGYGTSRPA